MSDLKIPDRYNFAESVPGGSDGGARCSTCRYLSEDGEHCRNKLYKEQTGTRKLGDKAEQFCCMVWRKSASA